MPFVPGFKYDLFVSYAHLDDRAWHWVTDFVLTLKAELESKSREFTMWWDPGLRSGEAFDTCIEEAICESAVFLSILSLAYGDSTYCRLEVEKFRNQRHPAFGMIVGNMSRMQGIVIIDDNDALVLGVLYGESDNGNVGEIFVVESVDEDAVGAAGSVDEGGVRIGVGIAENRQGPADRHVFPVDTGPDVDDVPVPRSVHRRLDRVIAARGHRCE